METIFLSIGEILNFQAILFLFLGIIFGTIFGAIPGLTATMGVALFLPITFTLDPILGILLLIGVYVGGISGGLIAATLLGIPGTPSSVATTFDAYPMAKKGEPVRALGIGITASLVGGLVGFAILVSLSPIISRFAVKLGPFEYFSLTFFAITLISVLSKGNMIKGLTSGFLGIAISLIGFAPIGGTERFTLGIMELKSGVSLLPLMMGLFAISQIFLDIKQGGINKNINLKVAGLGLSIKEFFSNMWNMIRSSLIGVGFGILPGMGSGVSNIVAYAQAKQSSKKSDEFGKGSAEGIFASESSNNASVGGALIPLLALGIPGDTVTAILLGGFMIHGIQPGPLLMKSNPLIVSVVFLGFLFSIILVFLVQMLGMRLFPRILKTPDHFLFSILLVMTVIGAYTTNYSTFDIWVMLFFGLAGYILLKNNYPLAPMILGFVLGPMCEMYFRRAVMNSDSLLEFFTRPVSGLLLVIAFTVVIITLIKEIKYVKQLKATAQDHGTPID